MVISKSLKRYVFPSGRKLVENRETNFNRRNPRNAVGSPNQSYFPVMSCFQPKSTPNWWGEWKASRSILEITGRTEKKGIANDRWWWIGAGSSLFLGSPEVPDPCQPQSLCPHHGAIINGFQVGIIPLSLSPSWWEVRRRRTSSSSWAAMGEKYPWPSRQDP